MELRLLKYFIAVAEELHFGHAAERLCIAQPALSIQIKGLEKMLGGQLFLRSNKKVALTEAGKLFLKEARNTLRQADLAELTARQAFKGKIGGLDIGYSEAAAYSGTLGKIIQHFKKARPAVSIYLHELNPIEQVTALKKQEIHVGLTPTLSLQNLDGFIIRRISSWPMRLVLPQSHKLAAQPIIELNAIQHEPFIVFDDYAYHESGVLPLVFEKKPLITHTVKNASMMAPLVGCGLGLALLPSLFKFMQTATGTVFKPLAGLDIVTDCSLIYRKNDKEPLVQALNDCVSAIGEGLP